MENTKTVTITNKSKIYLSMSCIACGEPIRLTEQEETALRWGHHVHGKICEKCKAAILYMREQMELKWLKENNND